MRFKLVLPISLTCSRSLGYVIYISLSQDPMSTIFNRADLNRNIHVNKENIKFLRSDGEVCI